MPAPKRNPTERKLRAQVMRAVNEYCREIHARKKAFKPGDRIPYAARVFDGREVSNLVHSSLDFWLTAGRFTDEFERRLSGFLGVKRCSLVNSGSSANLLAFMALTAPELGKRRILPEDEVITAAAGFPTTVAPIIQYGAVPVFVDIDLPSYNADCGLLEKALSCRTKAVMLAHTLGNPFDLAAVKKFCNRRGLWLIEDNCDSLGARVFLDGRWRCTGTVGDIGTSSFYPPHHITMGEGGAVYTGDPLLKRLVDSFRDWGRDCWCPTGRDNTCGRRFARRYGSLPLGYDHKYVYARFGYNLKATDMQAAVGCAQLEKLPGFIEARKRNWKALREGLAPLSDRLILPDPSPGSDPSWFGFLLTVKEGAGFKRDEIVRHLEGRGIQTRMLFAGNILRHPCFEELWRAGSGFRIAGNLRNSDRVMRDTFWIGVYPGLTPEMIAYVVEAFAEFFRRY